jgi:hypothetical protein
MNEETKKLVREASRYAGLCEAINELMTDHAGELQWRECASSSTWPSEWILKGVKG